MKTRAKRTKRRTRKPLSTRKSKILSGRLKESTAKELKSLYPQHMTESEIISELVNERIARAKFDQWILGLKQDFKVEDFDLESLK